MGEVGRNLKRLTPELTVMSMRDFASVETPNISHAYDVSSQDGTEVDKIAVYTHTSGSQGHFFINASSARYHC